MNVNKYDKDICDEQNIAVRHSLHYKTMLTIAGSDSVGGAGIQADIKTATALGVYAMTAITAVTAQNTMRVIDYDAMSPLLLRSQLDAVCDDVQIDAVKIGMIPTGELAGIIADVIKQRRLTNVVVDPVAVATSRDVLSGDDAVSVVGSRLFPLADIITPNVAEAALHLHCIEKDVIADTRNAARRLLDIGSRAVLITGGDTRSEGFVQDLLMVRDVANDIVVHTFKHPYIDTCNTHGTGCSLSSAIASYLAKGCDLIEAVTHAEAWINQAIAAGAGYVFGHGHGPINHMFNIK